MCYVRKSSQHLFYSSPVMPVMRSALYLPRRTGSLVVPKKYLVGEPCGIFPSYQIGIRQLYVLQPLAEGVIP